MQRIAVMTSGGDAPGMNAAVRAVVRAAIHYDMSVVGFKLASISEALSGQETRATVLGYIQRGGSPSAQDRILGSRFGARAVELLKEDTYGRAIGIRENRIIDVPFSEAVGHPQPLNRPLMDLVGILGK